ncbi:hypothetical protein TrVE_jg6443 [Triparma verrucosa]|uniref:PIH1 N-terminal domain-containing protein n=1 Tax=Triparma verrucosa TaxID=1606542 RepID=A0A9W7EY93_9STRA|nr:hypothetical protein TrVE_jg6443 [Triparma verrucosa]
MNLGIQHGARPGDFKSKNMAGGLPKEVVAMAKQMGLDMATMGSQAEDMWAMLNDMSEKDPDKYEAFIKEQMEGAEEGGGKGQRTFTPTSCFVVKTRFAAAKGMKIKNSNGVDATGKLFVNMCSHDGVQRPLNSEGQPVAEDRPHLDNMQIPLVVSDMRSCTDNSDEKVAAVDVVYNPWVIKKANENNVFRAQVVELGLNWVQQEQNCKLESKWKVIKSKYKGGGGENGWDVVPFPVDESMLDPKDREAIKKDEEEKRKRREAAGEPVEPLSPAELLSNLKKAQSEEEEANAGGGNLASGGGLNLGGGIGEISLTGKPAAGKTGKPLIQEVGADKKVKASTPLVEEVAKPKIQEVKDEKPLIQEVKPKGKPLTKQMKGFLNKKADKEEGLGLYKDGGSSGDGMGGKGGSYSRFMNKCKVVDTSSMSPEEQEKMMKKHANGSGTTQPAAAPPMPTPAPAAAPAAPPAAPKFDGLKQNKGFLKGAGGGKLYGKKGSSEGDGDAGTFDAEFAKLMEKADPEFNAQFKDPRAKDTGASGSGEEDVMSAALSALAGVGSLTGEGSDKVDLDALTKKNEENVRKQQKEKKERMKKMAAALVPDGAAKVAKKVPDLAYSTKVEGDGSCVVTFDLKGGAGGVGGDKLSMDDMDLEVSEGGLRLMSKLGAAMVDLGGVGKINCEEVKAKLSQKKRTLRVTLKVV